MDTFMMKAAVDLVLTPLPWGNNLDRRSVGQQLPARQRKMCRVQPRREQQQSRRSIRRRTTLSIFDPSNPAANAGYLLHRGLAVIHGLAYHLTIG